MLVLQTAARHGCLTGLVVEEGRAAPGSSCWRPFMGSGSHIRLNALAGLLVRDFLCMLRLFFLTTPFVNKFLVKNEKRNSPGTAVRSAWRVWHWREGGGGDSLGFRLLEGGRGRT